MTEYLSMDQVFIKKLTDIVLASLANENFGADELAKEAGVSRASLYRKLQFYKHEGTSQFIREVRLKRGMEMLQNNEGTASEIAFRVGFGSPAYFNKCFHDYYGYPPGEVRKRFPLEEGETYEPVKEEAVESKQLQAGGKETLFARKKKKRKRVILLSAAVIVVLTFALVLLNISRRQAKDMSIIVLPFKNLSDDPDIQHIADGITEDILNTLYKISELKVISWTTSEHFRETNLTAKEIAQEVNARYILEGSMRQYEDKIRINVQLINAYRDNHLWSANFDRGLTDILGIQSEIALHVANKLNAVLSDNEVRQIGKITTQNSEAYDNYLRGRVLLHKSGDEQRIDIDKEGLMGSLQYFEKAIAADENFTDAYAGMAHAWLWLSGWGWINQKEGFQKAIELSTKALELDPDCAEAHAIKGSYHVWQERRFEEGRKELLTALQLNPNYPPVHQSYTQLLMITGPIEEARIYMDRALKLEPYYWVLHNLNAWIYYFEDRNKEAIEACHIARDLKSDYIFTNWLLFLNYAKMGEGMKATEELQGIIRTVTLTGQYDDEIMDVYNKSGVKGLFAWLIDININKPIPATGLSGHPFFIAWWFAIIGDRENSIYWLERNMEAKPRLYVYFNLIATNPDFDILRNDPRFLAIIEKIGLTPYNKRKAR